MPLLTDEAQALERLEDMLAYNTDPVLTETAVIQLLDEFKRASVWVANTAYVIGDVVIPITRNGHRFVCTVSGTSHATTEPIWPDYDGGIVSEGSTLQWEEAGREYDLWDLQAAAAKGWALKAALAAQMASITIGDNVKAQQQVYDHCREMARYYTPIRVA